MNSFCSKCGYPVTRESRFCTGCGESISQDSAPSHQPKINEPDGQKDLAEKSPQRSVLRKTIRISLYVMAGIGSLLVVIIVLAIIFGDQKKEEAGRFTQDDGSPGIPIPTATPIPPISADLREMLNLHQGNNNAANRKWKNKIIVTEGTVRGFSTNYFDIIPVESDMFQESGARCYLPADELLTMDTLVKGTRVKVRGIHGGVLGSFISHIRIRDCSFKIQ